METIIEGQNYKFCIVAEKIKFHIRAIHLVSLRYSFINNLNAVLSEFNIRADDKKISDSQWVVSKRQSNLFFKKANMLLLNQSSRNYIERKLDEDRRCGEWENFQKIK